MVELRIPRGRSRAKFETTVTNFEKETQKMGPRKLVNIQVSPPPSSRAVHPSEQVVRQTGLEALLDEVRAVDIVYMHFLSTMAFNTCLP